MMGIGGALFAELRFAAGRILSSHFSEYRVLRFKNMPQIGGAGDRSCREGQGRRGPRVGSRGSVASFKCRQVCRRASVVRS